ncbi:alpha/beta fold family hydrolase [Trichoderma guizhouense]|uniref:Alpha/beta fold family hydrolase n=1 Tax=Trichoderma guizhouense TaxID=1491466 RepID=A0A1T3CJ53_9HYPO|nr:alpha/beta fold family hydrolase [Trichoderma guizhouense]
MSEELFASLPSGCRICYQVFGNPSDTAILLISGHSCAMTQKTDWIIGLLSPPDYLHFIIRFDHRDTGRSTSFTKPSDGTPVYTLDDMVEDIVGLIKHLKLTSVHLVGTSLGGTLAWQTASRLPDVVRSLALVLTSPVGRQQIPSDNLPRVHLEGQWLLAEAYEIPDDRDDDEGWIQSYMRLDLALATQPPTEEEKAESRRESEITYYREKESGTMWTKYNHSDASGVRWPRELLKQIRCPTVVIHAAKDQIFPLKHAEALRDDVEGATLVIIEDCGHEIPHRVRPQMVDAILANVKKAE